jgi:hypothetical protein
LSVVKFSRILYWLPQGTHPELDGNGEEIASGLLGNSITTWNTREVDKRWGDYALLATKTLENRLGESVYSLVEDLVVI